MDEARCSGSAMLEGGGAWVGLDGGSITDAGPEIGGMVAEGARSYGSLDELVVRGAFETEAGEGRVDARPGTGERASRSSSGMVDSDRCCPPTTPGGTELG